MIRNLRLGMGQQLQVLGGGQLEIERHQDAAAIKHRISRNQPFRLIGHDDRGPIPGAEIGILERARQRQRHFFKVGVSEPRLFLFAVRLDQADLPRPALQCFLQCRTQAAVLVEIQHAEIG